MTSGGTSSLFARRPTTATTPTCSPTARSSRRSSAPTRPRLAAACRRSAIRTCWSAASRSTLSDVVPSETSIVHVTGTPDELRFALNGQNPGFDVDLYVKEGLGVSTIDFDCKADSASNFAECLFPSPTAGPWSVLVQRFSGTGRLSAHDDDHRRRSAGLREQPRRVRRRVRRHRRRRMPGSLQHRLRCVRVRRTEHRQRRSSAPTRRCSVQGRPRQHRAARSTAIDPRNEFALRAGPGRRRRQRRRSRRWIRAGPRRSPRSASSCGKARSAASSL